MPQRCHVDRRRQLVPYVQSILCQYRSQQHYCSGGGNIPSGCHLVCFLMVGGLKERHDSRQELDRLPVSFLFQQGLQTVGHF